MDTKKLFGLIFCAVISIVGCSNHPDSKILAGKYCFNRFDKDSQNDLLFVNGDNSYKHKFVASDGHVWEANGKWEYDSIGGEILFKDFRFFNDAGPTDLPPGNWYSKVIVTDKGEVRLMYSSENNIYFSKK